MKDDDTSSGPTHTPSTRRGPEHADGANVERLDRVSPWGRGTQDRAGAGAGDGAARDGSVRDATGRGRREAGPSRPIRHRGFRPAPLRFATAPLTIALIVVCSVIEIGLALADSGVAPNLREAVYREFGFSPILTLAFLFGETGAEGLYGLVGHIFLHGDLLHLVFNMFALALFGPAVEAALGRWRYALLFLIAGIGGALGHGAWQIGVFYLSESGSAWPLHVQLVGASGAISGVIAAEFYRQMDEIRRQPPMLRADAPAVFLVKASAGFVVVNILISLMGSFISGAAHLGGFFFGLLVLAVFGVSRRRAG